MICDHCADRFQGKSLMFNHIKNTHEKNQRDKFRIGIVALLRVQNESLVCFYQGKPIWTIFPLSTWTTTCQGKVENDRKLRVSFYIFIYYYLQKCLNKNSFFKLWLVLVVFAFLLNWNLVISALRKDLSSVMFPDLTIRGHQQMSK